MVDKYKFFKDKLTRPSNKYVCVEHTHVPGRFGTESFRPWVVSALGCFSLGRVVMSKAFCFKSL